MYENWKNYIKVYEGKKLEHELAGQLRIFDERSTKKFVEYFVQWADLFRALSI